MTRSTNESHPGQEAGGAAGAPLIDDLLRQVALGDRQAFEALYQRGATRVHSVVRHVVLDAAVAEEVAFDVWLQVWRSAPKHDAARSGAMEWLLTTARRNAIDRVRSSPALKPSAAESAAVQTEPDPATLVNNQSRAMSLAYRGRTCGEISTALGVERRTVMRWLSEGVERAWGSFDTADVTRNRPTASGGTEVRPGRPTAR